MYEPEVTEIGYLDAIKLDRGSIVVACCQLLRRKAAKIALLATRIDDNEDLPLGPIETNPAVFAGA